VSDFVYQAQRIFDAYVTKTTMQRGPEYIVPAGLECSICRVDDLSRPWRAYVTKKRTFMRRTGGTSGAIVLQFKDWLLLTREGKVKRFS
jgi:hypothetical protein